MFCLFLRPVNLAGHIRAKQRPKSYKPKFDRTSHLPTQKFQDSEKPQNCSSTERRLTPRPAITGKICVKSTLIPGNHRGQYAPGTWSALKAIAVMARKHRPPSPENKEEASVEVPADRSARLAEATGSWSKSSFHPGSWHELLFSVGVW